MNSIFRKIGEFLIHNRLITLIISIVMLLAAFFGASQLTMATGMETYISTDSTIYQDFERFNEDFGSTNMIVLVQGDSIDDLLSPENLAAMDAVESQMAQEDGIKASIGPALFIKGVIAGQTGIPALPEDLQAAKDIVIDSATGQINPQFRSIILDEQHAIIVITLDGSVTQVEQGELVTIAQDAVAGAGFNGVEAVVTGDTALSAAMESAMTSGMGVMGIVSIVMMLAILAFIFSVRGFFAWRWLPLGIILIGIIYAFGIMGLIGIQITMVTMAILPIIIGLGVDYAIQFHNRYDEEARRGKKVADAILESLTHIGPAIGGAIIAACLGFASLFFSPVPMIQDFGLTLIISVVICYLVSIFILLTILYTHDHVSHKKAKAKPEKKEPKKHAPGVVERGLARIAPWVIGKPAVIIPIALVLAIGGIAADSQIGTNADTQKYISQDIPEMQTLNELQELMGSSSMSANILIEAGDVTDPAVLAWMLDVEADIAATMASQSAGTSSLASLVLENNGGQLPQTSGEVKQILNSLPEQLTNNLINADSTASNLVVNLYSAGVDKIQLWLDDINELIASPPSAVEYAATTGSLPVMLGLFDSLSGGRVEMTLIGIGLVFVGLLFIFRLRVLRSIIAVLPIAFIIGWSNLIMLALGIEFTPLTATLGSLIIGIGVEFTILLMYRYYEERGKGESPVLAMTTAITKIGRAIITSGLTVIGGFSALLFVTDFPILSDFGVVTMINVTFALVSSLLVLPPLIVWVDSRKEKRQKAKVIAN